MDGYHGSTFRHIERERLGPEPSTLAERLAHTVKAFNHRPGDELAIEATRGVYGDGVTTGLTWDDLRALALLVGGFAPRTREVPTALARLRAMHGED